MAVDRKQANLKMIDDASEIQGKTKEAIWRIQRQAQEAEGLGVQTLEELRRQGQQMDDINSELEVVGSKLDQSSALQSQFDRWAGNWLGGKKNAAMKEAAAEIHLRNQEDHFRVKEVFQHEKYDSMSRTWKRAGNVLCTNPSVTADDIFDPYIQEKVPNSHWIVDFSLSGIDAEGWTYAYDFATLNRSGAGESTPKWNSYVRRRKWRFNEKTVGNAATLDAVRERNNARVGKANTAASKQADKIGYVPRNKQAAGMTATGLTSAGMTGRGRAAADQQLDDESAAGLQKIKDTDAEIDQGLDEISKTIDSLSGISKAMKDEALVQNKKLDQMDHIMQKTTEKQTVVNARQRYLLK